MEKERERQESRDDSSKKLLEHDVNIHGSYIGKISLPEGATLADLLEAVMDREGLKGAARRQWLKGFTLMLNDRKIEIRKSALDAAEDGTLKENPALTENSTLSLLRRFTGGFVRP